MLDTTHTIQLVVQSKSMGAKITYPPDHKSNIETIHHTHNYMQPSRPKNPRNIQRCAPNPHHSPKYLRRQPHTQMAPIPTPTRKPIQINNMHPQPNIYINHPNKPTTNSESHNQNMGSLQHTCENQTHTHRLHSRIQESPLHYSCKHS